MTYASRQPFALRPLTRSLSAAFLFASQLAHAQVSPVPDSGALLQQLRPVVPALPSSKQPSVDIEQKPEATLPASPPVAVTRFNIVGNTAFEADTLHALVAGDEGKSLTLAQIEGVASRITDYYQRHGFPLSRAIVPAQSITNGVVTIQVIEARYGQTHLENRSKVTSGLLDATLAPLGGDRLIAQRELDRSLLLLSDIPGVGVSATIKPGANVGTSDIDVEANQAPTTLATISADNFGNRYIGRARGTGNLDLVNPLHLGDVLSATVVTTGSDMNYGRLAYDLLVTGQGTRVGASYSFLHYRLGDDVSALDAHGIAGVASAWVRQPIVRSRQFNLYGQLEYDQKRLRDDIDATGVDNDRHLGNWVLSLNGDVRDGLLLGGIDLWSVAWTNGRSVFDNDVSRAVDAATARTGGGFSKWNVNVSRLQALSAKDTVYLSAAVQWADENLDSAEKLSIGGPYSVRAYDIGAISGDTGYVGNVEWRHDLGAALWGRWQATAFFDGAFVKVNRHPWVGGENSATLAGGGVGLNWAGPAQWSASVSLAARVGHPSPLVADPASVRAWMVLNKAF